MRKLLNFWTSKSAVVLLALLTAPAAASAQAIVAAQRGAELAPFVQAVVVDPDWGQPRDTGYTAGVDFTHFGRSLIQPSLEARYTSATGTQVNESSFTGGLKLGTTVHGVRPYMTLLAGYGDITFVHPRGNYLGDNSTIYSFGGGVDIPVRPSLRVRIDFTEQSWNLDPDGLTPMTLGVGFSYSLPFRRATVK